MSESQRAGDAPIGVDVVEGNHIIGVLAEKVTKQPFCDGSHKDQTLLHYNTKQINPKKFFYCHL